MKTIITLAFTLIFTLYTQGQDRKPETRVETISRGVVLLSGSLQNKHLQTPQVARLYRRPYTRVKRALTFTTPGNRPKIV